jgi:hypothetical protein
MKLKQIGDRKILREEEHYTVLYKVVMEVLHEKHYVK